MRTRSIGGLEVSVVGLGSNNFGTDFFGKGCDERESTRIVHAALDAGITFIDTAEEYSVTSSIGTGQSEQFIGRALGKRRGEVIIATKFLNRDPAYPAELGAKRIIRAVEGSLRRLQTDYIDLLQQHQPDDTVPIEESLRAMDELVRAGKVREIGCCNFSGSIIDEAATVALEGSLKPLVSAQNRYNLLELPRQENVLEACSAHDMRLLPFFPLASGLLTGKYSKGQPPPSGSRLGQSTPLLEIIKSGSGLSDDRLDKVERLGDYALASGHTLLELAFSWLASQPVVGSIIAGATSPDQVTSNAKAASWQLTDADFEAIADIVSAGS